MDVETRCEYCKNIFITKVDNPKTGMIFTCPKCNRSIEYIDEKDKRIKELEDMFKKLINSFCKAIDVFLNKQNKEAD